MNIQHSHRSTYEQLRGLVDLLAYIPTGARMVEIGCYDGDSAEVWCAKVGLLICVDPWSWTPEYHAVPCDVVEKQFDEKVWYRYPHIVTKWKMPSLEAATKIPDGTLDAIYIDGRHEYEYVRDDLRAWAPKVKPGGLILGHDYWNPITPGVKQAVNEVLGEPNHIFCDWSFMKRKAT